MTTTLLIQLLIVTMATDAMFNNKAAAPVPQTPVLYYYQPIKLLQGYELKPVAAYMPLVVPDKTPHKSKPLASFINRFAPHNGYSTSGLAVYPMKYNPSTSFQMDQQKRNYLQQLDYNNRFTGGAPLQQRKLTHFHPSPVDFGFRPIIKPSLPSLNTFNGGYSDGSSSGPHKYGYVRDYVDLLKKRQKEHFSNEDLNTPAISSDPSVYYQKGGTFSNEDSAEPTSYTRTSPTSSEYYHQGGETYSSGNSEVKKSPEIQYFQQRESEIGKQHHHHHQSQPNTVPKSEQPRNNELYKVHDDTVDEPRNLQTQSPPSAQNSGQDYEDDDDNDDDDDGQRTVNDGQRRPVDHYESYREPEGDQDNISRERPVTYDDYRNSQSSEDADDPYRVNFDETYYGANSEEDPFAGNEEESKTQETVAPPIQVYSQVRHTSRKQKLPKPIEDPRIREKISTGKTHIVYKEEGYEDKNYDHGSEQKKGEIHSKENTQKQRRKRKKVRQRRDLTDLQPANTTHQLERYSRRVIEVPSQTHIESQRDVEIPCEDGATCRSTKKVIEEVVIENHPVDPTLFKYFSDDDTDYFNSHEDSSEPTDLSQEQTTHIMKIPPPTVPAPVAEHLTTDIRPRGFQARKQNLNGSELLRQLSDIIKNSSLDISDSELAASRSNEFVSAKLPNGSSDLIIPKYFKQPQQYEYKSLYRTKPSASRCEVDTIPNLTDKSFNGTIKKRGGQLGDKLECLKGVYFGADPFDHPFFNEELTKTEVPKLRKRLNNDKKNVSVSRTVYDDVMNNINRAISLKEPTPTTTGADFIYNFERKYQTPPPRKHLTDPSTSPSASYEVRSTPSFRYVSPIQDTFQSNFDSLSSDNKWQPISKTSYTIPSRETTRPIVLTTTSSVPMYSYNLKYQPPPSRPTPTVSIPQISSSKAPLIRYHSPPTRPTINPNNRFSPLVFPEATTEPSSTYEIKGMQEFPLRDSNTKAIYPGVFDINQFYPNSQYGTSTIKPPIVVVPQKPPPTQQQQSQQIHQKIVGPTTGRPYFQSFDARPQSTVVRSKLLTRPTYYRTVAPMRQAPAPVRNNG